jgi:hypothetical protein
MRCAEVGRVERITTSTQRYDMINGLTAIMPAYPAPIVAGEDLQA